MNILLLDDEPFVLKLLARMLADLGFAAVETYERAEAALDRLRTSETAFDLVFCDLNMPEMDGVEFVRHLVGLVYVGDLVLVSGEDRRTLQTAETLARAHRLNVLGTLQKPVSPDQLARLLERRRLRVTGAQPSTRKVYTADELRRAITCGELVNHYQPKISLATGAVEGVETLVRWRHPTDGMVLPDQFIAVAEEHGLIDDLTRVVLTGALGDAKAWRDEDLHLHLAVNVSMDNLDALDFPDFIFNAATALDLPLSILVLEVTESRLMKSPLAPLDILTRLRLKRIGLSIDDFGTGYSSLIQLRDLPFDEMKIDRSFVHGSGTNADLRAMIEASLSMARQLDMKTVAEGVEDEADWLFLRTSGCDLAQGYFIARSMPAESLSEWITAWETRRAALYAGSSEVRS